MGNEEKIIYRLKKLAKKLNKTPTKKEYILEYGNPGFEKFGGYTLMVKKAELRVNMHIQLSNEEIQIKFKEHIKKYGIPKATEIPKSLPSYDLIKSRFGNYKFFLQSIGYDTSFNSWDRNKIIKKLQEGIDSGEIKSREDLNKKGYPTMTTIREILKISTWKETLNIIDRKLISCYKSHDKYNFTEEELKKMYINLSEELGKRKRGASEKDIREHLGFNISVFQRVFKKEFVELKKEWGYTPRTSHVQYTSNELLEILKVKIKEKGRYLTLREIIIDKDLPAINTFYRIFNTKSFKKIYSLLNKEK